MNPSSRWLSRRSALKSGALALPALAAARPEPAAAAAGQAAQQAVPATAASVSVPPRRAAGVRFGVNYLPSRNWWYAWEDWDPASVRADLTAIARLGFDHIRIQCLWPLFQPNGGYVSQTMTGHLAELLDIAGQLRLEVEVTVLDGYLSGYTFAPVWLSGRNMLTDPDVIAAQQRLIAALAGRIGQHPAFLGFDLSNEIDQISGSQPGGVTQAQGDAWATTMLAYCDQVAPGRRHVNGAGQNAWFFGTGFSQATMASAGSTTAVHYYDFGGTSTSSPEHEAEYMIEAVKAYAADPARPVWLEEFGVSTGAGFYLPPAQLPDFLDRYIRNIMTCPGLWGWTLWASHDIVTSLTGFAAIEYGFGMLDTSNRPTPAGQRVAKLIGEFRASPPQPAQRSTALVLPDSTGLAPGGAGQPFVDLIGSQQIRPAIVLASRSADQEYLRQRGITELITIAEVDLLDGQPFASLAAAFNNVGITDDSAVSAGNMDGFGSSYSAQALAATGITPGAAVTDRGLSYTWPDAAAGAQDDMKAAGQAITISGAAPGASVLGFVGAATNGPATSQVVLAYTDGTFTQTSLTFSDWALGGGGQSPAAGNTIVASMPYRNSTTFGQQQLTVCLFAAQLALDPSRVLAAIAVAAPAAGTLNIFALATG